MAPTTFSISVVGSIVIVVGVVMSIVGLAIIGRFSWEEVVLAFSLLPGALLGFLISRRTARLLDKGYVRTAVLVVSGMSGLVVLLTGIL